MTLNFSPNHDEYVYTIIDPAILKYTYIHSV